MEEERNEIGKDGDEDKQQQDDAAFRQRTIKAWDQDLGSRAILADEEDLIWYPAEVNTSIRPGWFWHESQNGQVKSPERLVQYWFESAGRNTAILLNLPPDRRGLIHERDAGSVLRWNELLQEMFAEGGEGCYIESPLHSNWGGRHVHFGRNIYANFGLTLVDVRIQDAEPPTADVVEAFKAVETAKQTAEAVVNEAKAYQNAQLPSAEAQANKLLQNAQYLKQKRINEATEAVAMFEAMYAEYVRNPEITRSRMYYEAISEILPGVKLFINTGRTLCNMDPRLAEIPLDGMITIPDSPSFSLTVPNILGVLFF